MTLYAENFPYWKTGRSEAEAWIEKARTELQRAGATEIGEAYGADHTGRAAYMITFTLERRRYNLQWPVLQSKDGNTKAARIQAATALYHDIKARALTARVLGIRSAWLPFELLPDGRTAGQAAAPELAKHLPRMLPAPPEQHDRSS